MAPAADIRIGALAREAGVSTRTIRYYEQRLLLPPAGYSPGGERRYDASSLLRLRRIRELADILGSDLDEIRAVLDAEDRLATLRSTARPDDAPEVRLGRLDEAERINTELQDRVRDRLVRLSTMLTELQERRAFYDGVRAEIADLLTVRPVR